ncbi:DNRLRE domain-containing protein [Clostridium sp. A1-XYC3]|uniref:DNRLRE domain-containing protein n=1 Tax=Clostridium tanneri TaxID=3037988 RepID=A0ABU4JT16_9CLOT|nr:DNRLRE domain-containing protein [Clostridium sp. A1-XYC3]MDW8801302.1 DNRLRE domain-containing protein [Clostridium sp. A1-XYC3]
MPCLDIPATKSLTVSSKYPNSNINNKYIYIGNECSVKYICYLYNDKCIYARNECLAKYISYLYFDISSIPGNIKNIYATLVLFKKPILCDEILYDEDDDYDYSSNNYDKHKFNNRYIIYPLSEYFSDYTTYKNRPKYDCSLEKSFFINEKNICEEIDITPIVSNWISGKIPNKGLMFKGEKKIKNLTKFFSVLNRDIKEIPFIKIYFETEKCFIPFTELSCTYSLFPQIKEKET